MGIFTKKYDVPDITPEYGLIGENGNHDPVTNTWDIDWTVVDIGVANALVESGTGEDRGYRVVNGLYYRLVYLPPPPHLQTYE